MNQSKDMCGQIQPTSCKLVTFVLDIRIQILPHLLRIMKTEFLNHFYTFHFYKFLTTLKITQNLKITLLCILKHHEVF